MSHYSSKSVKYLYYFNRNGTHSTSSRRSHANKNTTAAQNGFKTVWNRKKAKELFHRKLLCNSIQKVVLTNTKILYCTLKVSATGTTSFLKQQNEIILCLALSIHGVAMLPPGNNMTIFIVGSCFQSQQLIQHREEQKREKQRQEERRSNAGHMPKRTFC